MRTGLLRSGCSAAIPHGSVLIDFDDNRLNVLQNALPVMREYGFAATVFVITRLAVSSRKDGVLTVRNPTFAAVTTELGIGAELCWPSSPRQKGREENLVGWVKGSFFKQRRLHDLLQKHGEAALRTVFRQAAVGRIWGLC